MRRARLILWLLMLGALAVGGIQGWQWFQAERDRPLTLAAPADILIPRGAGLAAVAREMERIGAIDSRPLFQAMVLSTGRQKDIKAGEYRLTPGMTLLDAVAMFTEGRVLRRQVTIPEGLTTRLIWQQLEPLVADGLLLGPLPDPATVAEGSLAPDTYQFERGMKVETLIQRMARAQAARLEAAWAARVPDLPLAGPQEMLTLASLVERETSLPTERARIAGVFVNRLRQRMRLQSDPTVLYAVSGRLGRLNRPLTRADLEQDSPWNSYTRAGLPQTPIAHPGREALMAVARPEVHDLIYFVALGPEPGDGHAFAQTYDQHLANVRRYRAAVAAERGDPPPAAAPSPTPTPTPRRQRQRQRAQ